MSSIAEFLALYCLCLPHSHSNSCFSHHLLNISSVPKIGSYKVGRSEMKADWERAARAIKPSDFLLSLFFLYQGPLMLLTFFVRRISSNTFFLKPYFMCSCWTQHPTMLKAMLENKTLVSRIDLPFTKINKFKLRWKQWNTSLGIYTWISFRISKCHYLWSFMICLLARVNALQMVQLSRTSLWICIMFLANSKLMASGSRL